MIRNLPRPPIAGAWTTWAKERTPTASCCCGSRPSGPEALTERRSGGAEGRRFAMGAIPGAWAISRSVDQAIVRLSVEQATNDIGELLVVERFLQVGHTLDLAAETGWVLGSAADQDGLELGVDGTNPLQGV